MGHDNGDRSLAIVGMGCRLPGDVDSPEALWRLLADGRDAVGDPPPDRVELAAPDRLRAGGYLRDVTGFDADFFGVSRPEADVLDPQHRLLLEVAWEALEHAGLPPDRLSGTDTGVYVGISYDDYTHHLAGHPRDLEGATLTNGYCVAAGRISYLLGLHGPCVALDTACSSSLVALHLAGQALLARECDLALAGGVNLLLWPTTTRSFERMGMLSPTDRCHPFDADADGFVRSEGCGVVVVKRLADAVRDGDRVLAIVRGSAVNQDGRSDGLAAPSAAAQQAVYRRALTAAGVRATDIGLIEAHGTGTPVGDPTEFASLNAVYGPGADPCALGSVKSNVGHLEPAAGVTGLIKAVLCLWHRQTPPSLHFRDWNPAVDTAGSRLYVPRELTPWTAPDRFAAVSSFGFSGTNAHVILEQAASVPASTPDQDRGPDVILVAAASSAALPGAATRLADWLEGPGSTVPLAEVAYTLARRRSPGRGRLGVVAGSRRDVIDALRAHANGQVRPGVVSGSVGAGVSRAPVWVFSGQGSQWAGMGRDLLASEPAFAATLALLDPLIRTEAGFSILDVVRSGDPVEGCGQIQPLLFATQLALAATWRAYGVEPAAVIGHSMGEVAAAVVAGALSIPDGVRVICRRSALLTRIAGAGSMASVGADAAAVDADLIAAAGRVTIAVHAAPGSTVVAGDTEVIDRLIVRWEARAIPARLVAVGVASHSPQVDPLLDDLRAALADLAPGVLTVPFYSTVLDRPQDVPAFDADYWCANLRRPVRFADAIAAAAADRHTVFVEVSPHPVVTQAISASLAGLVPHPVVLPTLRREEPEQLVFRTQLAALHCAGVPVDWSVAYASGCLADPPPITFDRRRHWVDRIIHSGSTVGLPGVRTEIPGEPRRYVWRGDVGTDALPWLADHRVHGEAVLPGAAYCAIAIAAGAYAFEVGPDRVELTDVRFRELLRLGPATEITTTVAHRSDGRADCDIFARGEDGSWIRQASGVLRRTAVPAPSNAIRPVEAGAAIDPADLYAALRRRGIDHGPAFAGITALHRDGDGIRATITRPGDAGPLPVHPILLDIAAQTLVADAVLTPGDGLVLPVGIASVRVTGDPATAVFAHAHVTESTMDGITGDVRLLDRAGRTVVEIDGLAVIRHGGRPEPDRWFLEPAWTPAPLQPAERGTVSGSWLLIGDGHLGEVLAAMLGTAAGLVSGADGGLDRLRERVLAACPDETPAGVAVLCRSGDDLDEAGPARLALATAAALADRYPDPPRLYVITQDAGHPAASAARGIVRTLAYEQPGLRATLITADPAAGPRAIVAELRAGALDDEVSLRGGERRVAHLAYAPLSEAERAGARRQIGRYATDRFRLRAGHLGDLDTLELTASDRQRPGPDEVEIRIIAAGLNFRDVLTAMGLLPGEGDVGERIGFECSGVVVATGADVTRLHVGDDVIALRLDGGAFGSFITVPADMVVARPTGIDPVTAAGLPIAFLTAWYALRHVARVAPGERVLIHSATGGTGLAAVAVARLLGAEVLATAGSEEKRAYLRRLGIERVMDSRSLDFVAETQAAGGVDVVLNSLAGPAIRGGLEVLRPFGRFVELGVRDIIADTALGLAPLRHNITLGTVDLIELRTVRPDVFASLLAEVFAEFEADRLAPLPVRAFPVEAAADAFRLMASARHIGKLVLTVPAEGTAGIVDDRPPVHADGSYIVTGGLRGVGLATVEWLAGQGAGHIVVNGRRDPDPDAERALRGLPARISVVTGDIAAPDTAARLVAAATEGGQRLRGVIHSAMVLADAAATNVTDADFDTVWRPKVTGAIALHDALTDLVRPPDWFVVYSSMSSLLGNPGQAAYAAANGWLDGFAEWRTGQGLPTLAINWGPWGEIGVATDFARRGYQTIPTAAGLDALGLLLRHHRVRTAVIPGSPESWIQPAVRTSSLFRLLTAESPVAEPEAVATDIRAELAAAAAGPARRNALETYLAGHIRAVLRLDGATLDPQTPLRALGFDSLLSMDLRVRIEAGLGVKLPGNFVYRHPTLQALAVGVAERMGLELEASGSAPILQPRRPADDLVEVRHDR